MASSRKPARAELPEQVRAFLEPRLFPAARLCLGYSGGLDSTVLLHVLAGLQDALNFRLSAVHVHHGLSPHADAWAALCAASCRTLAVPVAVQRVRVEPGGQGLEAAARQARYGVYAQQAADFIVLAHHLDDQVETVFLRLLRGAGVAGLAGMPEARLLDAGRQQLLRPLLGVGRQTLHAYATAHALAYCQDESNFDLGPTRNFLRQAWLPQLEGRFPAYRRNVARAAAHMREGLGLLADLAELDMRRVIAPEGLDLACLAELGPARAKNLLRHWLVDNNVTLPDAAQLEELLEQMLAARPDAAPELHLGGRLLRRRDGRLCLGEPQAQPDRRIWSWCGEQSLDLGACGRLEFRPASGAGLAAAKLAGGEVEVRLRAGGEHIRPDCRRPRRALKKLLQESGMPAWQRPCLPVLWAGGEVVWVAGVGVDCASQAVSSEPGWLISWHPRRR